jgi:hypothetical protein
VEIEDRVSALDFDLACTVRLNYFDTERMQAQAKFTAYEVSKMFGGETQEEEPAEVW